MFLTRLVGGNRDLVLVNLDYEIIRTSPLSTFKGTNNIPKCYYRNNRDRVAKIVIEMKLHMARGINRGGL